MQLASKKNQGVWFSTEPVFGKMNPQPEICVRPLGRKEKIELIEACTSIVMVSHPAKAGQYLQAERFDKFRFAQETLYHCIVDFKHFERNDGAPLQATPADIEYLLESLDESSNQFELWLQECVKTVSDHCEQTEEDARKN